MRIGQAATLLAEFIRRQMPALLTGAPGVGKSDLFAQAAESAGADLILSHPVVEDPTDAKGLPWVGKDGASATFLPFGEMARALAATELTVWALDDLGQASPAVQAAYMQLLLARRVNGHILPDCVTFVAATNRRTDRAGVTGILEPVKSRFATIIEVEPNIDDWCAWAFDHDVPAELIAFLRFRPELLSAFQPTADMTNSPVPRTWAHAGKILAMGLPHEIQHQAIAGAVGQGAAVELGGFLRLYKELPNIDAILLDPDSGTIPREPAARYAVVTALAMRSNDRTFGKIARYAERLTESAAGEFAALLIRDAIRKDENVVNTPEFVRLASGELGQLIGGGR